MLIVMEYLNLQQNGRWYFLQRPLTLAPMPKQEWDNQALELDDPVARSVSVFRIGLTCCESQGNKE